MRVVCKIIIIRVLYHFFRQFILLCDPLKYLLDFLRQIIHKFLGAVRGQILQ